MKRVLVFLAVGALCTSLTAQEAKVDFPAETARIFGLKKAGQKAMEEEKFDEAAKAFQGAVDAQTKILGVDNPETLLTMGLLAGALEKEKRWQEAYKLRETLLDADRRMDGKATEEVVWAAVGPAIQWGVELFGGVNEPPKDLACARDLVRRLRERSKPFADKLTPDNALDMAAQWIEAWTECRGGNARRAIKVLEPGIKVFPQNAWGHMAMAFFCWEAGDKDLARDWYLSSCEATKDSASTDQEYEDVKKRVTSILFGDQPPPAELEPAEYFAAFDRLLAAYPQVTPLYGHRGLYAAHVCRTDQALADFRKAIEFQPEDAWNWYRLAIASLHAGQVDVYKKTLQGMYEQFAASEVPFDRHLLLIVWSLAPNPETDGAQILEMANRPDRIDDSRVARVLYRCGKFDELMTQLEKRPDGILLAMKHFMQGDKLAAQRNLAQARPWVQSHRDPVTKHFLGGGTVMEHMEGEIMWNEAEKMIGPAVREPFLDKVAELLVGDWTASGTITGEGDSGVLKVGDKFTMVASFQLAAGGKTIIGTQKLTVLDRPNVSADCSVLFAWDPVDMVVRIFACWSDGSVEVGSLSSVEEDGFRGDYTIRLPDGHQEHADIALEKESQNKFVWVFKSGPHAGKPLSSWQRK